MGAPDARETGPTSRKYDSASTHSQSGAIVTVERSDDGLTTHVSTGARWEKSFGYSRAAARGPFVFLSGTSAVEQSTGNVLHRGDAYAQTKVIFEIASSTLQALGASLNDVVRTRIFLRNLARDSAAVSRAHGEFLGGVRPASSMVEVSRLVHPDILVLIEFDAVKATRA